MGTRCKSPGRILCILAFLSFMLPSARPADANNERAHDYGLVKAAFPDASVIDEYSRLDSRAKAQIQITDPSQLSICKTEGVTCKDFVAGGSLPTADIHCAGNLAGAANGGWVVDSLAGQCWSGLTVCYGDGSPGNCAPVGAKAPAASLTPYSKCTGGGLKGACSYGATGLLVTTGDDMFRLDGGGSGFLDFAAIGALADPYRLKWIERIDGAGGRSMMIPSGPASTRADYKSFTDTASVFAQAEDACYPVKASLCDAASLTLPPVAGQCGKADGVAVASAPSANLCFAGTASAVKGGSGSPWSWTCTGWEGGATASCSAPAPLPVNGVCGRADSVAASAKPTSGLCSVGSASAVSGSGPWKWSCNGSDGGSTASCSASIATTPVNGVCGSSSGTASVSKPSGGLCSVGVASAVSGSGPWSWSCAGTEGGANASCSASVAGVPSDPPIPQDDPPPGQTHPPTEGCFFWVSGVFPSHENNLGTYHTKIGDTSLTWNSVLGLSGASLVGSGSYPDSYGSPSSPGPFFNAANGTFDGLAIGKHTRVTIYKGRNFGGGVLFDQKGPLVVGNINSQGVSVAAQYAGWKAADWSSYGSLFAQFPPSTRVYSTDAPVSLSAGGGGMWVLSGLPTTASFGGYGPTSIKVSCDAE